MQRLVQSHGKRVGAARFVAGETLDSCVAVLRKLNEAGLHANTTLLGEAIPDAEGAAAVTAEYESIIERLVAEKLKANVALKLTHLGLSVRRGTRLRQRRAPGEAGGGARDVHPHRHGAVGRTSRSTLRIYERLRDAGHDAVGTVLQSYLYRTPDDLERLLPRSPNLRIVKGAYLEPAVIAYPEKADVDRAYVELVERGLRGGAYIAVATHDESIIRTVQAFAAREEISRDRFEFQMLYGVRPGAAALDRSGGLQGARGVAVRPRLVPVPHATTRRASGESRVLSEEPRAPMSALPAAADVVVVGGGVIGTSIAFHLAEAGADVCLVERDQLAGGSTSRAAGGVRAQFSDPLNIAIGLRSIEAFERFVERPGAEIDLHQVGYLFLLDRAEDVDAFEASVALQNELGVPSRFVALDEVARAVPARGARRRHRRHVLPARRARQPRGCHAGVRRRGPCARGLGGDRLRGDRDRPRRRRRAGASKRASAR